MEFEAPHQGKAFVANYIDNGTHGRLRVRLDSVEKRFQPSRGRLTMRIKKRQNIPWEISISGKKKRKHFLQACVRRITLSNIPEAFSAPNSLALTKPVRLPERTTLTGTGNAAT